LFNYGLSDKECKVTVDYNPELPGGMSTNVNKFKDKDYEKETLSLKVASSIIKPILKKHKRNKIILKIDTEGSEYAIMRDLKEHNLLNKIDCIMLEWHKFEGITEVHQEILDVLYDHGFICFQKNIRCINKRLNEYNGMIVANKYKNNKLFFNK
jgi:hypothetical protein